MRSHSKFMAGIIVLGGKDVCPTDYMVGANDVLEAFDNYLEAVGVQYFSGYELAHPLGERRMSAMRAAGYEHLVPPEAGMWRALACHALFADKLRRAARGPVKVRWAWRPTGVNTSVGGAPKSDHLYACALDLDFKDQVARMSATRVLASLAESPVDLNVRFGVGHTMLHVSLLSPNPKTRWSYR